MKRIHAIAVTLLLFVINSMTVCAQSGNKDIVNKLKSFSTSHTTEKVYLHLDKPYYATGDTIYFKAYVTMGERLDLSHLSGILHVDLINMDNKIDQSIKLQLANGLGWGDFALPDSLPKGNYRIRAYTQWMRNASNYFEQVIPVGSVHDQKIPESSTAHKNINAKSDLQFFPEGGSLVNGIPSKIAFKAIGPNGLGISAKGTIVDNSGKIITEFASVHLGMGSFSFTHEDGKTYKANIAFADGSKDVMELPVVNAKGINLSVNNDSLPKATVKIQANKPWYEENKGKDYTLLIYSGGLATTVNLKLDSTTISLDILKRHLHTGITRVTLFSATNEPLCERLLFVQNYDQLNLNINSDKNSYDTKGRVTIKLNAKTRADSAAMGHFSIAVIDESKVPVDENTESTILTDLLLTSDLKGTVEQPNYYFTHITNETLSNLDLVMLTHGYRQFEWKQVLSDTYAPLAFQPEKGLSITGTAQNLLGKSLAKATVTLLPIQSRQILTTTTGSKGNFLFDNLVFTDSAKFILQAVKAKGGRYTKLTYNNKDVPLPVTALPRLNEDINTIIPSSYLANNEKQQEELNKLGLGKGRMMREVKIKAQKKPEYRSQSRVAEFAADQVVYGDKLPEGLLGTKIIGVVRPHLLHTFRDGLILLDGLAVTPEDISNLLTEEVQSVEILAPPTSYIYGQEGFKGAVIITTKPRILQAKDVASVGILPIYLQGYYKAREFYSPKYEPSDLSSKKADLRTTIYWKPELTTDQNGNASFDYYNADAHGTYRMVVEGMDEKGNIGRQVYRYKVE